MTTLMVLMAGFALGGDGKERILEETEQRLAIAGYWEGVLQDNHGKGKVSFKVKLEPERYRTDFWDVDCRWIDEGRGKCRAVNRSDKWIFYGIYKRESGQLIICYAHQGHDRPTRFQPERNQFLLILKPVNPLGK
jgi:hypothetical protein